MEAGSTVKILVLSDLCWDYPPLNPTQTLAYLTKITRWSKPDLALLEGDLVDDKSWQRDQFWKTLHKFVRFLSSRQVAVLAVRGNWDEPDEFKKLAKIRGFRDISERLVRFGPLSILGISHAASMDIRYMRALTERYPAPTDIVLAHAQYRRRPSLLLLNTSLIVTGHFDTRLSSIHSKLLLSM